MASKCLSVDSVFRFRIRKELSSPTFLHFSSPTPLDHGVVTTPTVLREFGAVDSSAPNIKPDPDAGVARSSLPQPLRARRSRSAIPSSRSLILERSREGTPAVPHASSARASPAPSQHDSAGAGSVAPAGSVRPPTIGHVHVTGGIASSASRAGTPRPPRPQDFDQPPILAPPSERITRSSSMRATPSSKTKVASSPVSGDPSLLGITAPDPMDPNDYVRYKRSCQLTDDEKGRNRKGKSSQQELATAWFEYENQHPLRHPPNLSGHSKIQHGDVFWYRSPFGIQLWLWTEGDDDDDDFWRPVPLGVSRSLDGRYLGLNPSQKPSWVTENWLGKQKKNNARVFVFKPAAT